MKRHTFAFLVALALLVPSLASGQSLDELIARNMAAKGGEAKLKSIQTVQQMMTLSMPAMGMEAPIKVTAKRPNKLRQDVEAAGMQFITAFDGTTGWTINPMQSASATKLQGDQLALLRTQADIDGLLLSYKNLGMTASYVGAVEVDGKKVHQVDFMNANGGKTSIFLDPDTFLETRMEMDVNDPNQGKVHMITELSDYRDVNGTKVPHKLVQKVGDQVMTQVTVNEVKMNEPVEDSVFAFPGQ